MVTAQLIEIYDFYGSAFALVEKQVKILNQNIFFF
jgi:hypothetical protein